MQKTNKKFLILGASRGLGWATYEKLKSDKSVEFFLVSRKIKDNEVNENTKIMTQDFSKNLIDLEFFNQILQFNPTQIIYCAGGGPYGIFENKKWSDHQWSIQVNFLYPAQLIHLVLSQRAQFQNLKSITCVGSRVAESNPDIKAASYAAAKHALRGLLTTLQAEGSSDIQIKLFSPTYMLTDLLPLNSAPRIENKAADPKEVAQSLIEFIDSDKLTWYQ